MCPYVIKQREVELGLVPVFSVYFPDRQQGLYIFFTAGITGYFPL